MSVSAKHILTYAHKKDKGILRSCWAPQGVTKSKVSLTPLKHWGYYRQCSRIPQERPQCVLPSHRSHAEESP